ncbi:glycerophosphodiester phosphodiesterase [Pontibacter arcticus]|uniref:glycerophosphodiester phosphodiesterase n=1 Tax=Pontibacter arcticus TaxID=2080288 RepID=UPI0014026168|nr:glycerophosphodiester phosphodiesterase [Pontibacter arcticus]
MKNLFLLAACALLTFTSCKEEDGVIQLPSKTLNGKAPLIIGHRGSSGMRPDHTLEAYTLAIEQGADYIESDLVMTKDGVLICRHEPMLLGTTNVASLPEFASRRTTKVIDGVTYDDWFASDFTLAEIKKLRAVQPMADRPQQFNGLYKIPTFEEVIALAKKACKQKGRTIGIYPETKHPTFHENLNLPITAKLLAALDKAGWNNESAPVFIQSFEVSNLRYIRARSSVKLVQLLDAGGVDESGKMIMEAPSAQPYDFVVAGDSRTYNDLVTEEGLAFIKTYANGIGPWKPYIQPYNGKTMQKLPATNLIERAHDKGLLVHAFTFRDEARYLLKDYQNDPKAEYKNFYKLGLDGVFTDYPATAKAALK